MAPPPIPTSPPTIFQALTPTTLLLVTLSMIALYLIYHSVYNLYFHRLSSIPGPPHWALTDLFFGRIFLLGRSAHVLTDLHKRYGPILRIGPNTCTIIDPDIWKDVCGTNTTKHFQKTNGFNDGAPDLLWSDDVDHARLRKLVNHAFSDRALREQEDIVKGYVDVLIEKLRVKAEKGEVVNVTHWYEWTTFDIVGDLAFGESFGCLSNGHYHPWVAMLPDVMNAAAYLICARVLHLDKVLEYLIPKKARDATDQFRALTKSKISKRLETKTDRPDFWSYIMRYGDEEGKSMSMPEMEANGAVLIIAGSETTATALSGTTYALCRDERVMRKLKEEVLSSFGSDDEINMASAGKLEYLHAVLLEGMRLYPPVPLGSYRVVPKEGAVLAGKNVPGGTHISIVQYPAYHNPNNFYRPDDFLPERWLAEKESMFMNDATAVYQPFSTGPRNCIGQRLAWGEMHAVLARIVWNFDMKLVNDNFNPDHQKCMVLWAKPDLSVLLSVRQGS